MNNGLGQTIEEAQGELARIEEVFQVLTENAASYAAWKTLLIAQRVSGVQAHDARIPSVIKAYGIPRIVTFNIADSPLPRYRSGSPGEDHRLNKKSTSLRA